MNSMTRKTLLLCLLMSLAIVASGQRRDVHILAVNDAHAAIEAMPQLVAIADSLRALYPSLLVFSAGDNRTGNPLSDRYDPSGYPMVALMNLAGFNASAVGNHEFDDHSLARLCGLSAFRYLCANMTADDSTGISVRPYQVFDVEGLKVGVIGAVQINQRGTPDAHPDLLHGLRFTSPVEAVARHEWLSRQTDVTILLSHVGYQEDIDMARQFPWLDAIIGGHSHRQLGEDEPLYNGVLVTQNRNLLGHATHITLTVDSGRVVDKKTDYIIIRNFPKANPIATALLQTFRDNPYFKRVLTHAEKPFRARTEIGAMVCDAMMDVTGADIAIMNYKGIRINRLRAGDITVRNAFEIDPYGSNIATLTMRGDELEQFLIGYGQMNTYKFPHLGGMRADLTVDYEGSNDIVGVKLMALDGKRFDRRKTYRVVTNTYVLATNKTPLSATPTTLNMTTSDAILDFLSRQPSVNYQGKSKLNYLTK